MSAVSARKLRAAVFAAAVLSAAVVSASVRMRIHGLTGADALERAGGRECYSSGIAVNGVSGNVSVYGFGAGRSWRTAARLMGLDVVDGVSGISAQLPRNSGSSGYLVAADGSGLLGNFAVLTELDSVSKSAGGWPFDDIPVPAGVSPGFTVSDSGAGALMCVSYTAAEPTAAVSAALSSAAAGGWIVTAPVSPESTSVLLGKGNSVLLVSACPLVSGGTGLLVMRY